jgi:hypothetical protein
MKKTTGKIFRQGDVLIIEERIDVQGLKAIPREGGGVVLAHGESTGHMHQIRERSCSLFAMEDNKLTGETAVQAIARLGGGLIPDRVLEVRGSKGAKLVHEEHDTIKLTAGTYRVRIQKEYAPGELRNVAD